MSFFRQWSASDRRLSELLRRRDCREGLANADEDQADEDWEEWLNKWTRSHPEEGVIGFRFHLTKEGEVVAQVAGSGMDDAEGLREWLEVVVDMARDAMK